MKEIFILKAVFHNMKHRKSAVIISVLAVAAAFAFLSALGNVSFGLASVAVNSGLSFPLVIGPAGTSDAGLVTSAIFNADKPSGTLDYEIYEQIQRDSRVAAAFPIVRSDSYNGIPIVGVNSRYINEISTGFLKKEAGIDEKDVFDGKDLHRAVVGAKIARRYELEIGDVFVGSHGHVGDEGALRHENFKYVVSAVLDDLNGSGDFSIFADFRSVWAIHSHNFYREDGNSQTKEALQKDKNGEEIQKIAGNLRGEEGQNLRKITAVLVKTVNPAATASLEREFSENGKTSAADVGKTVRKIINYMNKAETAAGFFSYGTLLLVLAMVFVTILMALNERKKEMALMRILGIGRLPISLMILLESLFVSTFGILLGVVAGHCGLYFLKPVIDFNLAINLEPFIFTKVELQGIIITMLAGQILSLLAMLKIYNMNIVEEVAKE